MEQLSPKLRVLGAQVEQRSGDRALPLQGTAPTRARPLGSSLVPPSLGSAIRSLAPSVRYVMGHQ